MSSLSSPAPGEDSGVWSVHTTHVPERRGLGSSVASEVLMGASSLVERFFDQMAPNGREADVLTSCESPRLSRHTRWLPDTSGLSWSAPVRNPWSLTRISPLLMGAPSAAAAC